MAHRCCSGRRHYDSNSSDTELSEAEESRKSCIKRSKLVFCTSYVTVYLFSIVLMSIRSMLNSRTLAVGNLPIDVHCFLYKLSAISMQCSLGQLFCCVIFLLLTFLPYFDMLLS